MSDQLQLPRSRSRPYGAPAHVAVARAADGREVRIPSRRLRTASDERLVAGVRRGDARAFEAIYDRYHRPLLGFCRHMLSSREEAEDTLQQVFVAAHRSLVAGTGAIQLKPWLYAIARNRCLSTLRARRETEDLASAPEPSTDGLAVAHEVERREEIHELLGDLMRLPDVQRAALLLAEVGDLSQREIAVALGVRTDKVKALIFQAREGLGGWRRARTADCAEIQEQIAIQRGGGLRRGTIRRHVTVCEACAAFEREVARQRRAMALVLPVVPSVAVKHGILSAALSGGNAFASASTAGLASTVTATGAAAVPGVSAGIAGAGASAKAVAVVAVAIAVGAGGGAVAARDQDADRAPMRAAAPAPREAPGAERVPERRGSAPVSHVERLPWRCSTRAGSVNAPGRSAARGANGNGSQRGHGHQKTPTGARAKHPFPAKGPPPQASPVKARAVRTAVSKSKRPARAVKTHARKAPVDKSPVAKGRATSPKVAKQHSPRGQQPQAGSPATAGKGPPATHGKPGG